jgi:hypothetical protein
VSAAAPLTFLTEINFMLRQFCFLTVAWSVSFSRNCAVHYRLHEKCQEITFLCALNWSIYLCVLSPSSLYRKCSKFLFVCSYSSPIDFLITSCWAFGISSFVSTSSSFSDCEKKSRGIDRWSFLSFSLDVALHLDSRLEIKDGKIGRVTPPGEEEQEQGRHIIMISMGSIKLTLTIIVNHHQTPIWTLRTGNV